MDSVRFVLVRPGNGGNIGAAARALKNMGLSSLWLVRARRFDTAEAERLAHGAADVLRAAPRVDSLDEALDDCRWVVGTTRRVGRRRAAIWTPRAWAEAARAAPNRRPLAVLFGPEEDGLTARELARCHDLVRIPAHASQPSLNLAQAVLVLAYEWRLAELSAGIAAGETAPDALGQEVEGLYAHLEAMLLAVGFLRPDTAPHRMLALRKILGRARLRSGDVRLLRGICRQVLWAAGPKAGPGRARARSTASTAIRGRRDAAV